MSPCHFFVRCFGYEANVNPYVVMKCNCSMLYVAYCMGLEWKNMMQLMTDIVHVEHPTNCWDDNTEITKNVRNSVERQTKRGAVFKHIMVVM